MTFFTVSHSGGRNLHIFLRDWELAAVCWLRLMMILFVWSIIFTSIYHQGTKTDEDHGNGNWDGVKPVRLQQNCDAAMQSLHLLIINPG